MDWIIISTIEESELNGMLNTLRKDTRVLIFLLSFLVLIFYILSNQLKKNEIITIQRDDLTGFETRGSFFRRYKKNVLDKPYEKEKLSLLLISIDSYQMKKRRISPIIFNKLIVELGNIIQESSRYSYQLGRYSSDEFIVFM